MTHNHMQLVRGGIKIIEQPLRIKRSTGSGDGDEDLQSMISVHAKYRGRKAANKFASAREKLESANLIRTIAACQNLC